MDIILVVIAVLSLLILLGISGIGIRRWARAGYRYRLKTLLHLTTAASVLSYLAVEFILPKVQHSWAFHVVRQSRGSFYRGEVKDGVPNIIYVKNPWGNAEAVNFDNDYEAISSAHALKFLPEVTNVNFDLKVTDKGIATVLLPQTNSGILELAFQCPNMTDDALVNLGLLPSLESLMFTSSGITDEGLKQLKNAKKLRSLYLHEYVWDKGQRNRNRFGLAGYEAIGQLTNLINARIKGYVVADESASHLHGLFNLKKLDFVYCIISNDAIANLRSALPGCEIKAIHCVEPDAPMPNWF